MVKKLFDKQYLTLILIALLGILTYSNTFTVPFQFDDDAYVVNNPLIRTFHYFAAPFDVAELDRLSPDSFPVSLRYAFLTRILGYLSFAVNYRLHGLDVVGFHIFNLVLHLANASLLFLILRATLNRGSLPSGETRPGASFTRAISVIVPLIFVVHPIQTHAVTYITSRFVLLASFFFLLSLFLYIKAVLSTSPRARYPFYASALLSAVAAMLTKEFTFTLPFIIAFYDMTFITATLRERIKRLAPLSLTLLLIPTLIFLQQKSFNVLDSTMRTITAADVSKITRGDYLLTQFRVMTTYLRLLFFPVNQNLDYDFPVYHSLFAAPVFFSLLLLLALLGLAIYLFYRSAFSVQRSAFNNQSPVTRHPSPVTEYRLIAFGIVWFFITLSIESSIIPLGELIAEYRLYLPSIGIITAFTALVHLAIRKFSTSAQLKGRLFAGLFSAAIMVLAVTAHARNGVWKDEISLWEDAALKSPARLRPHQNLGTYYSMKGRLEDARSELLIAIKLDPGNFELHNNLGIVYRKMGDFNNAVHEYTVALQLMPDDPMARYNLGNVFLAQGNYPEAIKRYGECLRIIPDYDELHNNLGIAFEKTGRFKEAIMEFEQALRLNPRNLNAKNNLVSLMRYTGAHLGKGK
jgi:Flp pilus assembly protein TadD